MKAMSLLLALLLGVGLLAGCTGTDGDEPASEPVPQSSAPQDGAISSSDVPTPSDTGQGEDGLRISLSVGGAVFKVQLLDNASAWALVEQLPLTLEMTDYAGQEKVCTLPFDPPPAEGEKPQTIHAGELYLWSGNQMVLFYTTFANSYDGYVRLGAIEDADSLAQSLGSGDVTVTIESDNQKENNILIAYFSCTGNTEHIAQLIARHAGAELYPITPEVPYTSEDLDCGDSASRASIEQNDPSARPAIAGAAAGMESYDTIFLGYPIWWGQAPKIISTFLESYDFGGKTIVPFCTSGSSGVGSSDTSLHSLCADSAHWLPAERFSTSATSEDIAAWVNGLGIPALDTTST